MFGALGFAQRALLRSPSRRPSRSVAPIYHPATLASASHCKVLQEHSVLVKRLEAPPSLGRRAPALLPRFRVGWNDKDPPGAHVKRQNALPPAKLLTRVQPSDPAAGEYYSNRNFFRRVRNSVGWLLSIRSPRL